MQSARTSKITNDGLTRSGIGCFTGVPIYDNSGRQRVNGCQSNQINIRNLSF